MKNINKNAVQALWLDGKAYLAHKAIEGFTVGQGDFTIETSFICNDVKDCLIYAQDQGFAFGIRDKHLYFEQEGVGSITQEEVSVNTDTLFSAAVSCKDGKLSLYFEGLPAAEAIEVNPEAAENSGNYVIGKRLDGYIVDLRLRSCGMEDQEILLDNGAGLTECDFVEFWGDFTTVQYMDKSHNTLSLWTEQGIAKCMNVTSCTKLSLYGGFVTVAENSYDSGYTLLFKVYPQIENTQKMYVYSAVSGNGNAVFSIGIEPDDNGDSYAFVEHNGETYYCETILPLAKWIDIGLRIEGTDAALYIDGVKQLAFTFEGELSNITGVIGIKPFQNKVSYTESFWGYLDYFAEFECALDEEKIDFYAEEQPYIFDESIRTLFAFFCGEPIDLVSGNTVLQAGESKAFFEKNLNSMKAPVGMDLRVPQEVCAEWQELSEYEQWALTTAMDMVREVYSQSMGLVAGEEVLPIEQTATSRIQERYAEEIEEVMTLWTPENQNEKSWKFISGALLGIVGGLGMAVCEGGLVVRGTAGAKLLTIGTIAAVSIGAVVIVSGAVEKIATNMSKMENDSRGKMPVNDKASLQLVSLLFNHNGDPKSGSIHFHSDVELKKPDNMTYVLSECGNDMNMLLVLSLLGETLKVTLGIKNVSSKDSYCGTINMKGDNRFGEGSAVVKIPPLATYKYTLSLPILKRDIGSLAECYTENFCFYTGELQQNLFLLCQYNVCVYLQNDLPIAPWNVHQNEAYSNTVKDYPSLKFIFDLVVEKGNDTQMLGTTLDEVKEKFDSLLNGLYRSGILIYNYVTMYTNNYSRFKLREFIYSVEKSQNECVGKVKVNCTDCANIVSLIAAELGMQMDMNLIFGINNNQAAFTCNQIMSMPENEWHDEAFSYHQVAFYSDEGNFTKNAKIYDLSLKIDRGPSPGEPDGPEVMDKDAFLSGGYQAHQTDSWIINIEAPYTGEYYLERLIKKGQVAAFSNAKAHTEFDFGEQMTEPNELYSTLMQQYIRSYKLDDKKYANEIPQMEIQPTLLQEIGLELKKQNQEECVWSAPGDKDVTWFYNVKHLPLGQYLASVLMRYSCRLTEKDNSEIGERVFYGPDLLITYFEGNAYAIRCKDMEMTEEIARKLRSGMENWI